MDDAHGFHCSNIYATRGGSRISLRGVLLKERALCAREKFKATPTFRRTTPICVRIQWLLQLQIEKLC